MSESPSLLFMHLIPLSSSFLALSVLAEGIENASGVRGGSREERDGHALKLIFLNGPSSLSSIPLHHFI